ncbi:hypothetical protein VPHD63_0020 [Vibrio phage D63]
MTIQVTGTLTDPSGVVASTVPIRIIALQGLGNVGAGAITIPVTSTAGVYDFQLEPGRYSIEIRYGQVYELQGRVIVNDDSPSPVNLSGLLALTQPLVPAEIALVRELVAQAEQAVVDAEAQVVLARQAVTDAQVQVALATSEANRSAAQVALAAAQVNLATAQADRAELEANRASEITGLDTVADAVDLAITNEYLTARTQGDVDAERALKREKFAGSGWEHFGKHFPKGASNVPVNQGLWTRQGTPNRLDIGRATSNTAIGTSKTDFAVMQMAGFTVQMERLNTGEASNAVMKFPEAPTGAVTYDSATGTVFDFETQVDPKYGNIAPDRNEAVARAFGTVRATEISAVSGSITWDADSETATFVDDGPSGVLGANLQLNRLDIEVTLTSTTAETVQFRDGVTGTSPLLHEVQLQANTKTTIKFTASARNQSSMYIRLPSANAGATLQVQNWEARQGEVVTRRVDMWGFEGFLEAVTPSNPIVYPNGLIQSQATSMNGVVTVAGTRPISYYAVFTGDTGSVGRGVNFFAATAAQQEAMLADPKNNLYRLDDGRLVQFRVRQRTIAGAGNGDWQNVSPFTSQLSYSSMNRLPIQGTADSVEDWVASGGNNHYYGQSGTGEHTRGEFTAFNGNGQARNSVDGECYFLVGGTASRLNQGAYHPELNSFGSARWRDFGIATNNWNTFDPSVYNFSTLAAFTQSTQGVFGYNQGTGTVGTVSGRTNDNRFHDAIYADGLGGVVDYRWSANDRSDPKWGAQTKLSCESGEYRGLELLQRTFVSGDTAASSNGASAFVHFPNVGNSIWQIGDRVDVVGPNNEVLLAGVTIIAIEDGGNQGIQWATEDGTYSRIAGEMYYAVGRRNLDVSVSGNFTRTDLIGDPVLLLTTFPTGFEGGWIPVIPNGQELDFPLNKKSITNAAGGSTTTNDGSAWSPLNLILNTDENVWTPTFNRDVAEVSLVSYMADAKKTRQTTSRAVLNAYNGIFGVIQIKSSDPNHGALLVESIIGKVPTGAFNWTSFNTLSLNNILLNRAGTLQGTGTGGVMTHIPLLFDNSGSGAFKALVHQSDANGQATLAFQATELILDGTWGDNSRVDVTSTPTTKVDTNGNTVQVVLHELAIPYGLIKNEV